MSPRVPRERKGSRATNAQAQRGVSGRCDVRLGLGQSRGPSCKANLGDRASNLSLQHVAYRGGGNQKLVQAQACDRTVTLVTDRTGLRDLRHFARASEHWSRRERERTTYESLYGRVAVEPGVRLLASELP